MRKIFGAVLFLLISVLCACGDEGDMTLNTVNLEPGMYFYDDAQEPACPCLTLKEDNQFVLFYSILSSDIPSGTYDIQGSRLILSTQDQPNAYSFEIKQMGNGKYKLILDEESSALEFPEFADIPDGAEFVNYQRQS